MGGADFLACTDTIDPKVTLSYSSPTAITVAIAAFSFALLGLWVGMAVLVACLGALQQPLLVLFNLTILWIILSLNSPSYLLEVLYQFYYKYSDWYSILKAQSIHKICWFADFIHSLNKYAFIFYVKGTGDRVGNKTQTLPLGSSQYSGENRHETINYNEGW